MARPRKYSEEKLLEIVLAYMKDTPYLTNLKYADLVRYAQEELNYKDIAYQDFSRNNTVKEFIIEQKERKNMSSYLKNHEDDTYEKLQFDVDQLVDKYIKQPKQLKAVLKLFKESYDKSFELIVEQHESIKKSANLISEQEKAIKDLKEKNKKDLENLKEKNKKLREENKKLREFNSTSYKFEKLKYMYLLLNDMVAQSNFYIETENEIMDILKNFGYSSNDILDVKTIVNEDFTLEKVTIKSDKSESDKTKQVDDINVDNIDDKDEPKSNVKPFNTTKVNLPKFMQKNK